MDAGTSVSGIQVCVTPEVMLSVKRTTLSSDLMEARGLLPQWHWLFIGRGMRIPDQKLDR